MSTTTTNLGLIKPSLNDPADITLMNFNWDKLDEVVFNTNSKLLTSADDLNKITESGMYHWTISDVPQNTPGTNQTKMMVIRYASGSYQEVIVTDPTAALTGCKACRCITSSVASQWEWINPPMLPTIEYRTIERYYGEVVYVKLDFDGIIHKRTESGLDITPITYGTTDLTEGESPLSTGQLYFVYE